VSLAADAQQKQQQEKQKQQQKVCSVPAAGEDEELLTAEAREV
jgi:hypothetical protein